MTITLKKKRNEINHFFKRQILQFLEHIDATLLGCTELAFLFNPADTAIKPIDVTSILGHLNTQLPRHHVLVVFYFISNWHLRLLLAMTIMHVYQSFLDHHCISHDNGLSI